MIFTAVPECRRSFRSGIFPGFPQILSVLFAVLSVRSLHSGIHTGLQAPETDFSELKALLPNLPAKAEARILSSAGQQLRAIPFYGHDHPSPYGRVRG